MPVSVWCDGGSRGNPGPAAWAAVFENGAVLTGFLPRATNNQAEYEAVIHAMEHALDEGVEELRIVVDSQLIEGHLVKGWKVNKNRELVEKAKRLRTRFRVWTIESVPREENALADRLVNETLDRNLRR